MNPKALFKVSYGLYIVSSVNEGKLNGQIANTVHQVTADPAQIAIALNKKNLTHEFVLKSGVFSASVLTQETPMPFIGLFGFKSGRDIDKFSSIEHKTGKTGAPIVLENSVSYMEAEVVNRMDVGTHTIFVGKIQDMDVIQDHEPMTYAYYHQIKGGKSPENAPTHQKEERSSGTVGHTKHKCQICGYIYDPETGAPDSGVEKGTLFEKIPGDWVCPICSAAMEKFDALS